jgi:pimeloyl-ACP methyl ester carboxylesterase
MNTESITESVINPAPEFVTESVAGIQMHAQIRGAGEPLVLLHGFTGAGGDWAHAFDLDELARRYQLILPDLRGHGRSTNPAGTFTHRQCALDLATFLDRLGVGRIRAIGLSLGGNTLLHLATREPQRVSAMVLVSATMYYPSEARAIMRAMAPEQRSPEEWAVMRARHAHGDDQIRALWKTAQGFADSHDDMCFTPPLLATIRARTLIVYGDRDPLYPLEMGLAIYRAIPDAALAVVPGGGHGPIFTSDERRAFARQALSFLGAPSFQPA